MNRKIRWICAAFALIVLSVCLVSAVQGAAVVGQVLSTDIRAYINGYEIPAYNIDGKLAVLAADLNHYGFITEYNNDARKASVRLNGSLTAFTPLAAASSSLPVGTPVMAVYSSDITVELDGNRVEAFNVDNRMAIYFTALKQYGTVVYDDASRSARLTLSPPDPEKTGTPVYSTDKYLYIGEVPFYGVVKIGEEYFIPYAVLGCDDTAMGIISMSMPDGAVSAYMGKPYHTLFGDDKSIRVVDYAERSVGGILMGYARKSDLGITVNLKSVEGTVWTLDGRYPMIPLASLGAAPFGSDFKIKPVTDFTYSHEADRVGEILSSLRRDRPRETAKAIHDAVVEKLAYDTERRLNRGSGDTSVYRSRANRALSEGKGVCEDYAALTFALCTRLGIPCELMIGNDHAWNAVYTDGAWSYVDTTWDDPVSGTPGSVYLFVDAEFMARDHWWNGEDYPMREPYDPAWEQLDAMNITSVQMFRKCLIAQLAQKKTHFTLRNTVPGAYAGLACVCQYRDELDLGSFRISGGYDEASNTWEYNVEYYGHGFFIP